MALLGSKCPRLEGLAFVKGESVQVPSAAAPMVVEFWASWCGPCRAAFPHLAQLARKYRDHGLIVVGVDIEGDVAAARRFVAQHSAAMDYLVAVDTAGQAANALMGAAGVSGIPCAFVLDHSGIIRHYGHPMDPKFAQVLAQVCSEAGRGPTPQQQETPPQPARRPVPVTKSREELAAGSVRELKAILDDWGVAYGDLNEKRELVDRVLERCRGG